VTRLMTYWMVTAAKSAANGSMTMNRLDSLAAVMHVRNGGKCMTMTDDQKREAARAASRRHRALRRGRKLCQRCGYEKLQANYLTCAECLESLAAYRREAKRVSS